MPCPPADPKPARRDLLEADLRAAKGPHTDGLARRIGMGLVQAKLTGAPAPTVGRYEITSKIGAGGMGVVFRASDPSLRRDVAIKVLFSDSEEARARIEAEARALARLNHPHVVTVHDMGTSDGQVWIAMELVRGGHLLNWARAREGLGWRELSERFLEAARGLAAAHRAGVVHRDFKPSNVMIGDDGRARVVDFGLAVLDAPELEPTAAGTASSSPEGTPRYWAPEVERGEAAGPLSDQYSFCVAFGELLARSDPDEDAPEELASVLARGRADDPAQRWPSMAPIIEELEAVLQPQGRIVPGIAPLGLAPTHSPEQSSILEIATGAKDREEFRFEALRWLDRVVGFDTVLLGNPELEGAAGPRIEGFDPGFVARFREGAERYAPTLAKLVGASFMMQAPVRDVDVYSLSERAKTPFYNEVIGPKGSKVMVVGALALGGQPVGTLQLSRASRGTKFTDRELEVIRSALHVFSLGEGLHAAPDEGPARTGAPRRRRRRR